MSGPRIRVLVVEDSPTVRAFLVDTFNAAPDMQVVATAADGNAALRAVHEARPDVVSMDVSMPGMDGLDATRRIMQECPVPIVVVSSTSEARGSATFQALEAGALAFVRTPPISEDPGPRAELVETLRLMSEVKVVRRRAPARPVPPSPDPGIAASAALRREFALLAVGASTGGPPAILSLLGALPRGSFPPVLIVQHITAGFVADFVRWLGDSTGHAVQVATDGEPILAGHVYVAPDNCHMGVSPAGRIALGTAPPENGLRPAVAHLFRTVRDHYGSRAAAVLLSGMGVDGARQLLELRQAGALTFAQDRESALVFGMPGEAVRLEAPNCVMAPAQIGMALAAIASRWVQ